MQDEEWLAYFEENENELIPGLYEALSSTRATNWYQDWSSTTSEKRA